MNKLLGASLALFLCACAATAQPTKVAEAPVQCTTGTVADLKAKAEEQELELKADYTGQRLHDFVTFLAQFVNNPMMLSQADEAFVFQKGRAGLVVFFKQGCALGHATGPYEVLNQFVGRSA